jgi:hypothetical protein
MSIIIVTPESCMKINERCILKYLFENEACICIFLLSAHKIVHAAQKNVHSNILEN